MRFWFSFCLCVMFVFCFCIFTPLSAYSVVNELEGNIIATPFNYALDDPEWQTSIDEHVLEIAGYAGWLSTGYGFLSSGVSFASVYATSVDEVASYFKSEWINGALNYMSPRVGLGINDEFGRNFTSDQQIWSSGEALTYSGRIYPYFNVLLPHGLFNNVDIYFWIDTDTCLVPLGCTEERVMEQRKVSFRETGKSASLIMPSIFIDQGGIGSATISDGVSLAPGKYKLTVKASTDTYTKSFRVVGNPYIKNITPGNDATGVDANANIQVEFNEFIDFSSFNSESIEVFGDKSGSISYGVAYNPSTSILTLTPDVSFQQDEEVVINVRTGSVYDTDGNPQRNPRNHPYSDAIGTGYDDRFSFKVKEDQHPLEIFIMGEGYGFVQDLDVSFSCSSGCVQNIGAQEVLRASAAYGSFFVEWGGGCSGTGDCIVVGGSAEYVTATFAPIPDPPPDFYRLDVNVRGDGLGYLEIISDSRGLEKCYSTYYYDHPPGDNLMIRPRPALGSDYSWACPGEVNGSNCNFFSLDSNQTIDVQFTANKVTATAGLGGTILPAGVTSMRDGQDVTYQIIPDSPRYIVKDVLVDGASVGPLESYAITNQSNNHTIEAQFERVYAVRHLSGGDGNGSVDVSPSAYVVQDGIAYFRSGTEVSLNAVPASDSIFDAWEEGSICRGAADCSFTIFSDVLVTANFLLDSDQDDLPDSYEYRVFFDPFNPADARIDSDNDRLTNLQEYRINTNPHLADSDGNGQSDFWILHSPIAIDYHVTSIYEGELWAWVENGGYYQEWKGQTFNSGALGRRPTGGVVVNPPEVPGKMPFTKQWLATVPGMVWNTYGLATDGSLWAWGKQSAGRLGDGVAPDSGSFAWPFTDPQQVGSDSDWISIGEQFALKADGTLWGWGQTGYSDYLGLEGVPLLYQVGSDDDWVLIKPAGASWKGVNAFAMKANGTAWSIGVEGIVRAGVENDWVSVVVGRDYCLALKEDGSLWAWGSNILGQLGIPGLPNSPVPVQVGTDSDWIRISASNRLSAAIKSDGTLWHWGSSRPSNDPQYTDPIFSVPTRVDNATDWVAVDSGEAEYLALKADGSVWAWRDGLAPWMSWTPINTPPSDLILSNTSLYETPGEFCASQHVGELSSVDINSWDAHTYSLVSGTGDTNNDLFSIGDGMAAGKLIVLVCFDYEIQPNTYSVRIQTDDGEGGVFSKAVELSILDLQETPSISGIPASVTKYGEPYHFVPTASDPDGDELIFSIANKPAWASFDVTTGELTGASGANDVGYYPDITIRVSDGYSTRTLNPFSLEVLDRPTPAVAAGDYHTVGLATDGTVVAVGDNSSGQLNTSLENGFVDIKAIAAGYSHTYGLKMDGTVVVVGSYHRNNSIAAYGFTDIVAIAAGGAHLVGLKGTGSVVAYGNWTSGQLDTTVENGFVDIVTIAAGWEHTVGLKADGTVVAVGDNSSGQLNTSAENGFSDIVAIAAGDYHTVGLKSDGTVVAVGDNSDGQLNTSAGNGFTDIVAIAAGGYHTVGLKADGSVVAIGYNRDNQLNTSVENGFTDIVAIAAGWKHTVGLKADGSVVSVGDNADGQTMTGSLNLDLNGDSDGDGVANNVDQCPGFDDHLDINDNGIPDGCDPHWPKDFEAGVLTGFLLSGDANWNVSNSMSHAGNNSVVSPILADGQTAMMEINATLSGAGSLDFWYAVSSEEDYDFLRFYIDDIEINSWSGEIGWSQASFPVAAGYHSFKWVYEKDSGCCTEGQDRVWIDDISLLIDSRGGIDRDGDGINDTLDLCPDTYDPSQKDANGDGIGDACDSGDTDSDGLTDAEEFALGADPLAADSDGDGVLDGIDLDPLHYWVAPVPTQYVADFYGAATIAGVNVSPGDEVAVLGPDGVVCGRCVISAAGEYGTFVYGDDPATLEDEGAMPGDRLTFRIWDGSAGQELRTTTTVLAGPDPVVWTDGITGQVDLVGHPDIQTSKSLASGWNLMSIPVARTWYVGSEPNIGLTGESASVSVASIGDVFSSIAGKYSLIRSFDSGGAHTYDPTLPDFFNNLDYVAGGYGYWLKMNEPADLTLEGPPMLPADGLQLKAGWNLVGYWGDSVRYVGASAPTDKFPAGTTFTQSTSISEVLQSLGGNLLLVRSFDDGGAHTYDPALPDFFNDLAYMGPGYSYWIKVGSDCVLRY